MPADEKGVIIRPGGTSDGATMRARDVEFELRGVDVDPRIKSVMVKLAEINHVNTKAIAELAVLLDKMIDTMNEFGTIAQNMRGLTDKYLADRKDADVENDITTN